MGAQDTPLAVTDTHALIWVATGKLNKLGKSAQRAFERASAGKCSIYIPALALVELGEACHRGTVRVRSGASFEQWARAAFASGKFHEAPLTAEIIYVSERLYGISERGDRLIAATAVALDLPLLTRDPAIAAAAGLECVWA